MPEPVVWWDPVVVNREGASPDAALVFGGRVSPELPGEHVQNALAHPPALGESGEGEVIGVDFAETWETEKKTKTLSKIN